MEPLLYNSFQVRLAENDAEIAAAQALRYRVFYEEMRATPTPETRARGLDVDAFDAFCDHLLVIDLEAGDGAPAVVGTYRLLRRSVALAHGGFYSAQEYDVTPLLGYPGEIVELGRSCVDSAYRARGVMQLLWRGLAAYVARHDIGLFFGCASFPGIEPEALARPLAYLYYHHLAPDGLRPRALPELYVPMTLMPPADIDAQAALSDMPPLIKGYLRVGGYVGEGAVIDRQFNTTDVCVIVKTDRITDKYDRRYRVPT